MSASSSRVRRPARSISSIIGVSTTPGEIEFTRMPSRPYSIAALRVRLITPAFAVA